MIGDWMTVNERFLTIRAIAAKDRIILTEPLELGAEVDLMIRGVVQRISKENNDDGTFDEVYIIKGIIAEKTL
ncbi:MAG: hypothetical protein C5B59_12705 [Bacteroidetes bacterium]|nr:MAG: hypothetical protein C5B59_12705 [Bacteroidota bacterium]